jgi:hypothetical protein
MSSSKGTPLVDSFVSGSLPLDSAGLQSAVDSLGVKVPEFWAILTVETSGCGFLPDRRPKILFERHIFSERTGHKFDAGHPDLSNKQAGGYGQGGAAQYKRLAAAIALDRRAALESTSWGIGQVMGFNAVMVGYGDVEKLVSDMCARESAQVIAMAAFVKANKLAGALRTHDWARFAAGYNGSDYRINNYDTRLASSYEALDRGALPDLDVRSGQIYLTYLGFDPRGVDGMMGRMTRSAMNEFQLEHGLPRTDFFDTATLSALRMAMN